MKFAPARGIRACAVACGAVIVFLSGCSRAGQITQIGCTSSPEVEAAWKRRGDDWEKCHFRYDCWQGQIDTARALRDRNPKDLLAHRLLIEKIMRTLQDLPGRSSLIERLRGDYRRLAQRYPKNPAYPYLLASLEKNPDRERRLLEQAASIDPNFASGHEAMARSLYRHATPKEKVEARKHLDAFARLCPSKPKNLLVLVRFSHERAAWDAYASGLRQAITPQSESFEELPGLWELEFEFADPASFGALRDEVQQQIEALRKQNRVSDQKWLAAIEEGYKLVNDEAGKRWAEEERLAQFPCSWNASYARMEKNQREHGERPEDPEAAKAWDQAMLSSIELGLRQCPDDMNLLQDRLVLLAEQDGVAPELIESTGKKILVAIGPIVSATVASVYIKRHVRLDTVEELLDAHRRRIDESWKGSQAMGMTGKDLEQMQRIHLSEIFLNQELRVQLALALKNRKRIERDLASLSETVGEIEKSVGDARERKSLEWKQAQLWELRAESDALAGHDEAALTDYARSIESSPDNKAVHKAARELYVCVHGSDAGYDVWLQDARSASQIASEEVMRAVRRPLPEVNLPDLSGKRWTSADLRGKAVLLNIWATWCGPCQGELPHIQKLHESWKGGRNFRIVTVSVDENPGLIEPYVKERKYTFPVLIAGTGSFRSWAPEGIPTNYIVSPDGMIIQEQIGFGSDGDLWEKKMEGYLAAALVAEKR